MTRTVTETKLEASIDSMGANFADVMPASFKSFPFNGQSLTPAQAQTMLLQGKTLLTTVDSAKAAYSTAVSAKDAGLPTTRQLLGTMVALVKLYCPDDPVAQQSCGIEPSKPKTQLTGKEKVAAAEKRAATRAANGTQGPQQKRKAALAASATVVVLGSDGQPIGGSAAPAPSANPVIAPTASAPTSSTK